MEPGEKVDLTSLTPVQRRGDLWVKRDDLFEVAGVRGGKVRTCWALAQGAAGLVTASSRFSPQLNIVAQIARVRGIPARCHVPHGTETPEMTAARTAGADLVVWRAGYRTVVSARARDDATARGWTLIPFGMECPEAVAATRRQAANLPVAERLVVAVGSGMSLAGILHGLEDLGDPTLPVLGVVVGADPSRRLDRWGPPLWRLGRRPITLVQASLPYHRSAPQTRLNGIDLDPIYEAKCLPFLRPKDIFWLVGIRQTACAD